MNVDIPNLQIPKAGEGSSGRWWSKEGAIILFGCKIRHVKIGPFIFLLIQTLEGAF
jgi:hypothetical protein